MGIPAIKIRREVFSSESGDFMVEWPENLSPVELTDFERLIELLVAKMRRQAAKAVDLWSVKP